MNLVDAKNMTPSQRVLAMEALWEAMCHREMEVKSPDWHEGILAERRSKIATGDVKFVSLPELRKRLDNPSAIKKRLTVKVGVKYG